MLIVSSLGMIAGHSGTEPALLQSFDVGMIRDMHELFLVSAGLVQVVHGKRGKWVIYDTHDVTWLRPNWGCFQKASKQFGEPPITTSTRRSAMSLMTIIILGRCCFT